MPLNPLRRPEQVSVAGPGTVAIDRRVDRLDGGPAAARYRPRAPHRFTGGGPLHEVTAHRLADPGHWHLVTYGLSELDAKESEDVALSGWGFELTFRLATGSPGGDSPSDPASTDPEPLWAVDLLTNLAAYVWSSGHAFSPGHHVDLRGPIRIGESSDLTAAVIVIDPVLGVMEGPFGAVEFFQVVAVTADELERCRSWSTDGVVELLRRRNALLVTDLDRRSVLTDAGADPDPGAPAAGRRAGDGGDKLRVGSLRWRARPFGPTVAQLGAGAATALGPALRRRLATQGATFRVIGDDCEIRFVAAEAASWSADGARLELAVPPGELEGLAALFDGRRGGGRRPAWPGLRWRVNP